LRGPARCELIISENAEDGGQLILREQIFEQSWRVEKPAGYMAVALGKFTTILIKGFL
jgi:hypothetical protein